MKGRNCRCYNLCKFIVSWALIIDLRHFRFLHTSYEYRNWLHVSNLSIKKDLKNCRQITLKEEIFAGINFRKLGFTEDFAGINFRELSITKDFAGINFCESALFKDLAEVNLTFALKKIFPLTLVYGFENNLSKNHYFVYLTNDKIHVFFYKHSVFQSEAQICLSFS